MRHRLAPIIAAFVVALGVGFGGVATANASPLNDDDVTFLSFTGPGGALAGAGYFNSDEEGTDPGDAIKACDRWGDGWGWEMQMDINPTGDFDADRTASTRGHEAEYCTKWETGNLTEGTPVGLRLCKVKGSQTDFCLYGASKA